MIENPNYKHPTIKGENGHVLLYTLSGETLDLDVLHGSHKPEELNGRKDTPLRIGESALADMFDSGAIGQYTL